MKVILFDAMNLIHRARSGFGKGDHALTFSFFRSFKPLVEKFGGDIAYFVLEGKPKHRTGTFEGYKSNRPKLPSDFWRQQAEILEIMTHLPVVQIRHKDYECDDVIANLAKHYVTNKNAEVIVVSGDSDFIQLFDTLGSDKLKIFHPIKKKFLEKPTYNYLNWKSLKGDISDNIPGIKGVGDKTATKLVEDADRLRDFLSDPDKNLIFERNRSLIEFHWFEELDDMLYKSGAVAQVPSPDISKVRDCFESREFSSMINEKYWEKFVKSFDSLSQKYN